MDFDIIILGRILLGMFSVGFLIIMLRIRLEKRTGNQFFIINLIFWSSTFIIAIKPEILDSVLNTTGLVNRSQFLLSISLTVIAYLLYRQTIEGKVANTNLHKIVRRIAISNFENELKNLNNDQVDIVIVIVAKDEEKNIANVIDKINQINIKESYKILVINDGSVDNTENIARKKGAIVINHHYNLGIGAANKTGFLIASLFKPKIIVNIDADGQHDPKFIPLMLDLIMNNKIDLVYGSRFAKQSNYDTSSVRSIGNKFYTKMVNKLVKINLTDVTSGFRSIKAEHVEKILFRSETNFAIELAIRAGKNGLKIKDVPIISSSRKQGESQFHKVEKFLMYNINAIIQIFNGMYRSSPKQIEFS